MQYFKEEFSFDLISEIKVSYLESKITASTKLSSRRLVNSPAGNK